MKAAELFVKCLENEGVEKLSGIPGEENIDVMDALLDSDIQFVTTHHEPGAAYMADVYEQLTGDVLKAQPPTPPAPPVSTNTNASENMKLTEKLGELICPI